MHAFLLVSLFSSIVSALVGLRKLDDGGARVVDFILTAAYVAWAIYLLQA